MKRLYYVRKAEYDMIISDDGELRRVITCDSLQDDIDNEDAALDELERVYDDSEWDEYTSSVAVLSADGEILAEKEWEQDGMYADDAW